MSKSTEKADVWMPLYIGDYLADTTRLTTEQHGAYLLLILDYWRNGPPPDEKIVLQNVTRLTDFLFKKHWPVLQKFFELVDGHWHHKRIDEEMAKALSGKGSASERARKAAEARWGKVDASSNAQALPEVCPSQSPSQSHVNQESLVITSDTSARAESDDEGRQPPSSLPKDPAAWCRYFAAKHGVEINASSTHDRKKAWPIFSAWIAAGVTTGMVDEAIRVAHRDSSQPIAFLPAYVDRLMANNAAPRASPQRRSTIHDERARTIAALTGRDAEEHDDNDPFTIDATARRAG